MRLKIVFTHFNISIYITVMLELLKSPSVNSANPLFDAIHASKPNKNIKEESSRINKNIPSTIAVEGKQYYSSSGKSYEK